MIAADNEASATGEDGHEVSQGLIDRPNRMRGSRGKGMRVRTGCTSCKARHLKCDETQPTCRACQKSARECSYPQRMQPTSHFPQSNKRKEQADLRVQEARSEQTIDPELQGYPNSSSIRTDGNHLNSPHVGETNGIHGDGVVVGVPQTPQLDANPVPDAFHTFPPQSGDHEAGLLEGDRGITNQGDIEIQNTYDAELLGISPGSSYGGWPSISAEAASRWWFELLASDLTNRQFVTPQDTTTGGIEGNPSAIRVDQPYQCPSLRLAADDVALTGAPETFANGQVILSPLEIELFHHFVSQLSGWIDATDPDRSFAVVVPHMALRNKGLASAILALSARHLSLGFAERKDQVPLQIEQTVAVQYYNDTLSYLQREMDNAAFLRSDELLATVLVISTYEMIDGPGISWEKHLKGVFWIQRSQTIHGESEGLKKRIWWAWLRQDIWAAFRKRRRVLSFYKVTRPCATLDFWELVDRAVYVLGQCVNYASTKEEDNGHLSLQQRLDQSAEMWENLQEWWLCFKKYNRRLPTLHREDAAFEPIWINPPAASLAIQVHHFSKILLLEYTPALGGMKELAGRQASLQTAIDVICGIASCTTEDGPTIVSMQCVFGAGQHVRDVAKQTHIMNLLKSHRERMRWPHSDIAEELRHIWTTGEGLSS